MVVFEQAKVSEKLTSPPLLIQRTSVKAEDLSVLVWSSQVGVSAMPQPSHE